MLYHYFPTEDDLILALLTEHLEQLLAEIRGTAQVEGTPGSRLLAFISVYVRKSAQSRQRHVSAMNDVKYLPIEKQTSIIQLERDVIAESAKLLATSHARA
jgi:AcrR family transcriptional regulator